MARTVVVAGLVGWPLSGPGGGAGAAGQYEFLAAPQINLSLVYRVDKLTGDIIACQFAHSPGRADVGPGAFGVTACYRSGEGASGSGARAITASSPPPRAGGRRLPRQLSDRRAQCLLSLFSA